MPRRADLQASTRAMHLRDLLLSKLYVCEFLWQWKKKNKGTWNIKDGSQSCEMSLWFYQLSALEALQRLGRGGFCLFVFS